MENCRYDKGSGAMGLLGTLLVDGGGSVPRAVRFLGLAVRQPRPEPCGCRTLSSEPAVCAAPDEGRGWTRDPTGLDP